MKHLNSEKRANEKFISIIYNILASHADALRARRVFLSHERLLNGKITSVRWRLANVRGEGTRYEP